MFINDLMKPKIGYLCADDSLQFTSGESPDISTKLMGKNIHQSSSWYSANFNNLTFKQSSKIKYMYLGVIPDNQLNFKPHTSNIEQKLYPIVINF